MEQAHAVSLKLSEPMLRALSATARAEDVTPGQIIRDAIARDLRRRKAKTPVRADEHLVAPLQALLGPALGLSSDWYELQAALVRHGYRLHEAGGGLALHRADDGSRVCKASELGFSYTKLQRRLGGPIPRPGTTTPPPAVADDGDDEDFDVIERA
jgi:hypothetical protein